MLRFPWDVSSTVESLLNIRFMMEFLSRVASFEGCFEWSLVRASKPADCLGESRSWSKSEIFFTNFVRDSNWSFRFCRNTLEVSSVSIFELSLAWCS